MSLNHSEILRRLGYELEPWPRTEGGIAQALLVRRVSDEQRYVAKTLHPRVRAHREVEERLARALRNEAQMSTALKPQLNEYVRALENRWDRHLAGIYNVAFGVGLESDSRTGCDYLLMEYVPGKTLEQILDVRGSLPLAQVVNVALQVCDGMEYCQYKRPGFVHRDIKPGNLMIAAGEVGDETTALIKLIDFGISASLGARSGATEIVIGTPDFLAPELLSGGSPTVRSDIYALGVTLELLVNGRGDAAKAHSRVLPPGFSRLIRRCRHQDRQKRFRDFEELRAALLDLAAEMIKESWGGADAVECASCGFIEHEGTRSCLLCSAATATPSFRGLKERIGSLEKGASAVPPVVPQEKEHAEPLSPWITVPATGDFLPGCDASTAKLIEKQFNGAVTLEPRPADQTASHIGSFTFARYAVSNGEYRRFVEDTGYQAPAHWAGGRPAPGTDDEPVTHVSFFDAQAFCRWGNFRLPTAEEWEYAARGTGGNLYPWGNEFDENLLQCAESGAVAPCEVDAFRPGVCGFGAYNMAGNVFEWTTSDQVTRFSLLGGSFADVCEVEAMVFADVTSADAGYSSEKAGFRVVYRPKDAIRHQQYQARGLEFVLIPSGTFSSGCPVARQSQVRELAERHYYDDAFVRSPEQLDLPRFYISRFPVTNSSYRDFVLSTGSAPPGDWNGSDYPRGTGDRPVTNVSARDALNYCRWLGPEYSLPTAAQWEKAARGDDERLYPWGDVYDPRRLNGDGDALTAVDAHPGGASPYGVMDMMGNATEWVMKRAVVKGGSFNADCRYYGLGFVNIEADMSVRRQDIGFRCIRR